jgi:hypothetical protein
MPNQWRYINTSPRTHVFASGVLTGLIFGQILRIYQLCSKIEDMDEELRKFHGRLIDRGYHHNITLPLFVKGIDNATNNLSLTPAQREIRKKDKIGKLDERIFFHVTYHPQSAGSKVIQHLWRNKIFSPPGKKIFTELKNSSNFHVPIKRLVVAYHRAQNLGNLLLYHKLSNRTGLKASSFLT